MRRTIRPKPKAESRPEREPAAAAANPASGYPAAAAHTCPEARDTELLERWYTVHSGLNQLGETLLTEVGEGLGLAPSDFRVLWFLVTTPGRAAPMHELSRVLRFSTAGTTKLVDRLAQAGLAERHTSPTDRRVTLAALTEAGVEATVRASGILAAAVRRRIVEPLGEQGFDALVTTIGALATADRDGTAPCISESRPVC